MLFDGGRCSIVGFIMNKPSTLIEDIMIKQKDLNPKLLKYFQNHEFESLTYINLIKTRSFIISNVVASFSFNSFATYIILLSDHKESHHYFITKIRVQFHIWYSWSFNM